MREVGEIDSRGRPRVQTINDEPSMTVQSDAHLADITNILAQYGATGMEQLDQTALEFRDVSEFTDFHELMLQTKEAEKQFLTLPSKVREIFDHDVAVWLDSAHDEEKRDALVAAGFIQDTKNADRSGEAGSPPNSKEAAEAAPKVEGGSEGSE